MGRKSRLKRERKEISGNWESTIPWQKSYEYRCDCCGAREDVPDIAIAAISEMFDRDIDKLPTFFCDACGKGRIVPVNYPYSHDEHILGDFNEPGSKLLGEVLEAQGLRVNVCPCCFEPMFVRC